MKIQIVIQILELIVYAAFCLLFYRIGLKRGYFQGYCDGWSKNHKKEVLQSFANDMLGWEGDLLPWEHIEYKGLIISCGEKDKVWQFRIRKHGQHLHEALLKEHFQTKEFGITVAEHWIDIFVAQEKSLSSL